MSVSRVLKTCWSVGTRPAGRTVVFDGGSHLHLALGDRSWLLDHVDAILGTVASPDFWEEDVAPRRERVNASIDRMCFDLNVGCGPS